MVEDEARGEGCAAPVSPEKHLEEAELAVGAEVWPPGLLPLCPARA